MELYAAKDADLYALGSTGGIQSYPTIVVTVQVFGMISPLVNTASVSGGGAAPANATDPTIIQGTGHSARWNDAHRDDGGV